VSGVIAVVENERWVAAVARNWWAANRALDVMAPRFNTANGLVDSAMIDQALATALEGRGDRINRRGNLAVAFHDVSVQVAEYSVAPALHAAIEPMTATADWSNDMLELWIPTQAPVQTRAAAARSLGIAEDRVVVHPMLVG